MTREQRVNRREFLKLRGGGVIASAMFQPAETASVKAVTATDYGGER